MSYRIVRFYAPGKTGPKSNITGLSLEEAQKHCSDPKTRKDGIYFDGYTEE